MSRRWPKDPEELAAALRATVLSPPSRENGAGAGRTFALALEEPRWFEVCVDGSDPMATYGMPWHQIEDELFAALPGEDDPGAADPEWDYSERLPRQTDPARPIEGTAAADEPPPTLRELARNVS